MTHNNCGGSLGHTMLKTFISDLRFTLWVVVQVMQSTPQSDVFSLICYQFPRTAMSPHSKLFASTYAQIYIVARLIHL